MGIELGGPATQFIAALGAVVGGGIAIGSIPGALYGFLRRRGPARTLEIAGASGLGCGISVLLILVMEAA